ncbi:MAG: heme ABC transporter ATP-binding protein [Proteobacteria bacterium]|nr:heme ABC transporter ATP-binding protein [Pseudomonadota bacterium]
MSVLSLKNACTAPWGAELLHGISLDLAAGNILGLVGPNGAGKTSLLNTIVGDIPLRRGELLLTNRPPENWPRRELARSLAYLPQLSLLNFPYTVEEVILLGRSPHDTGSTVDREVLQEVLQLTDTLALRGRLYTQLSGGEKQRVQLARVFAQIWQADSLEGKLLLLDEPTAALDIQHQQSTASAIRNLAGRGCAVVVVIHDFNSISALADQVVVLDNGKQVAHGNPREVFTESLFANVFSADVVIIEHPCHKQAMIIPR